MTDRETRGLLETASSLVPDGIFAIEKDGYMELRNDRMAGVDLMHALEEWTRHGWTVHANIR